MKRKSLDKVLTAGGALVTIVLLVAGGLLMWGFSYANGTVHDQLAAQQIFFPAVGSPALADPAIGPYLNQYAGQQMTDGPQAQAYSDHFIAVHIQKVAGGQTYSQVSTQLQADNAALKADPSNATLKTKVAAETGQAQTLFQGETLRGLLLNAYGFWTFGMIAMWAAIAAFVAAALMGILVGLGLWHTRHVSDDIKVFAGAAVPA